MARTCAAGPIMRALVGVVVLAAACLAGARQPPGEQFMDFRPPPSAASAAWYEWYAELLSRRLAASMHPRAVTLHFSQDGSDETGDGSMANPFRTLALAQSILDNNPQGDIALRFRRGDVWRERVGLTAIAPRVTIGDYGQGPKPVFTVFEPVEPSRWLPDPTRPGVYMLADVGTESDIVWIKQDNDLERPLARMQSADQVLGAQGSWHFSHTAGIVYVRPRPGPGGIPVDPRTSPPFEVCRPSGSGVSMRGHGGLIENIYTEGWGMSRTIAATQESGILVGASGVDHVAVLYCESYYGPSHAIAHWAHSGTGGVVTFLGCRAGLCNFNGVMTETIFNTYAIWGRQDVVFEACEAAYGTLPSSEWAYGEVRRGRGFYGHTGGGSRRTRLIVARGCIVRGDRTYGLGNPSHFNDLPNATRLEDVRCFIFDEVFLSGPGSEGIVAATARAARVNCVAINMQMPPGGAGSLQNWTISGWAINCIFDVDVTLRTARFALSNPPAGQYSTPKFWNCTFLVRSSISGLAFSLDYDLPTHATGAELRHCVLSHIGPGEAVIGLGSAATVQHNNAYHGFLESAILGDPAPVLLEAPLGAITPAAPLSPIVMARLHTPGHPDADLDFDLAHRRSWRRDLGAMDWSRIYGDLDGDGLQTTDDLAIWEQEWTDIDGDGQATLADRAWLLRAIRWRERDAISRPSR